MPTDRCRSEIYLTIKVKGAYQPNALSTFRTHAVLSQHPRKAADEMLEVGRTEPILNTKDPDFRKRIKMVHLFETRQLMKVQIFNSTSPDPRDEGQCVGEATFLLSQIFQSQESGKLTLDLTRSNGTKEGKVEIIGENIVENRDILHFHLYADLKNPNLFSAPSPFFIISKINEYNDWIQVYQSPFVEKTMQADWGELSVSRAQLCNSDKCCPLRIEVFDGSHNPPEYIGEAVTNVEAILANSPLNIAKEGAKTGTFQNQGSKIAPAPTFTEYMAETDIQLIVAMDYSNSNLHPSEPDSLHHLHPDNPKDFNNYELALNAVGNIVVQYDSDKKIPLYGFAGRVKQPGSVFGPVLHCFKVVEEEVDGVAGLLQAYRNSFNYVKLHGPTLFAPLIANAGQIARDRAKENPLCYTILLVLTDGQLQDKDRTIAQIVKDSDAPLSIIIVGVKPESKEEPIYDDMRTLDGDQKRLEHAGRQAVRDIVQFTAFEKGIPATELAEKVLEEIPDQMLSYFEAQKKYPTSFLDSL